ncbi:DNA-binding FadR family transcriptional regulator [Bradyrhizobium diazoefficiens]
MTIHFNQFSHQYAASNFAHQETVARYRKTLRHCIAFHAGHVDPSLAGKTAIEVAALFWRDCAALSMLNAGDAEEQRLEDAIQALRFGCACGDDCTALHRKFHRTLLHIADRSLSASFRPIWSTHAQFIRFPMARMTRARALATIRHLPFYASWGHADSAALAMARYLSIIMNPRQAPCVHIGAESSDIS